MGCRDRTCEVVVIKYQNAKMSHVANTRWYQPTEPVAAMIKVGEHWQQGGDARWDFPMKAVVAEVDVCDRGTGFHHSSDCHWAEDKPSSRGSLEKMVYRA